MTRKQLFESVGGFDAAFHSDLAAVDFCLRVRQAGFEIILERRACMIHEDRDRVQLSSAEQEIFRNKWAAILAKPDPYYHRYLRLDREDTSLRLPTESASAGWSREQ
jgi:GT2 family glycosyltransferase